MACWYVEVFGIEVNNDIDLESIPKHCLLPTDVEQLTQVCKNPIVLIIAVESSVKRKVLTEMHD